MLERPRILAAVSRDDVPVPDEVVLVNEKALDADRATCVGLVGADANLAPKP
jgi:hypothetical protein